MEEIWSAKIDAQYALLQYEVRKILSFLYIYKDVRNLKMISEVLLKMIKRTQPEIML